MQLPTLINIGCVSLNVCILGYGIKRKLNRSILIGTIMLVLSSALLVFGVMAYGI